MGLFVIERKINQKRDRVIPPGDIALRNDPYYSTKSVHNLQNIGDFRKIRKSRPTERSWERWPCWCLHGWANILPDQITDTGIQWESLTLQEIPPTPRKKSHPTSFERFIPHFRGERVTSILWGSDWDSDYLKLEQSTEMKIISNPYLQGDTNFQDWN